MNSIEKRKYLAEKFNAKSLSELQKKDVEKTKLVVFDFDGTLVSSSTMFYNVMKEAMIMLKLPVSDYIIKNIFPKFDKEYFGWGKDLEEQKNIYVTKFQPLITKLSNQEEYIKQMYLFNNIKETIKILAKTDIALAIASSRDLNSILTFLKRQELKHYFSMIEATEGGINFMDKPNTSIVNYISQEVGISLENSVMIGDSSADILMGKNAGMKTIAVGYDDKRKINDLQNLKPDAIVKKQEHIPMIPFIVNDLLSEQR